MITIDVLSVKLGVADSAVREWIDRGMPVAKKRPLLLDPIAVRAWLVENDLVETDRIFRTRDEVAQAFGVTARKVSHWIADPTFPGRPGDKFEKNGHFPENEIRDWLEKNKADENTVQHQLMEAKLELERYKLAEKQGKLIDISVVEIERQRSATIAKEALKQLPFHLVALLPPETSEDLKGQIRVRAERTIDTVCEQIAKQIEDDEAG